MKTLILIVSIYLLAGCAEVEVPHYASISAPVALADKEGWYHFAGLDFKGVLSNGRPDGIGTCRSYYNLEGYNEKKESPCEFKNGGRIDELHRMRMEQVAINLKKTQQREDQERAEQEAERIRQNNESVRATDGAMRAGFQQFQSQLNDYAQQDQANARQIKQLQDRAIQQKQADIDAEERSRAQRAEREAKEKRAADELMDRARNSSSMQSNSGGSTNVYGGGVTPAVIGATVQGEHSTNQTRRKKYVHDGFNDNGARAARPELAIEQDIAQLKREAEKWVAERRHNGSVPIHGVITDMRVREGCTAYKQLDDAGGYWAKCILDITYEGDDL